MVDPTHETSAHKNGEDRHTSPQVSVRVCVVVLMSMEGRVGSAEERVVGDAVGLSGEGHGDAGVYEYSV